MLRFIYPWVNTIIPSFPTAAGSPVGWACYTGQLEIAKSLVRMGADAAATDAVLWGGLPPLLVAAQNGQV